MPLDDEPLVPPMIPNIPPPNAQAFLVESTPYSLPDAGLDNLAVRKAKRHQLQYLIEKGMSPKEIAAHLEMPVGEVELIFSLHKRLSGEATKTARQPLESRLASGSSTRSRVIPAENVVMNNHATTGSSAKSGRRFKVVSDHNIGHDDGEEVA
jgi:hypothetical protein